MSIVPATAYLGLLAATLVLNDSQPASWLLGDIVDGQWGIPLFWLVVVGGATLSVIGNLMPQLSPRLGSSSTGVFGVIAWVVLVLCLVTCLPIPWLFFVVAD